MIETTPFLGSPSATLGPFTATTTSANVAISVPGTVRVVNSGSSACRIAWGTSSSAAVTKPTPGTQVGATYTAPSAGSKLVLAGSVELFTVPPSTTHVSFATDSGTTTIEFTPGFGV